MLESFKVWWKLFRLSFRTAPWLSSGVLAVYLFDLAAFTVNALAIRWLVNEAGQPGAQLTVAVLGVAVSFALVLTFRELLFNMVGTLTDRVGRLGLNPELHRLINDLPGIEHLERSDYLDRVVIVRGGAGALLRGTWGAVGTLLAVLKIVVSVSLLATVSWWMPLLLLFALLPILANRRGQGWVASAEAASTERFRLQQDLFDLQINEAGRKELRLFGALPTVRTMQDDTWRQVTRTRFRSRFAAAALKLVGWTAFAASFSLAIGLLILQVQNGCGALGDLVLATTVTLSLQQSAQTVIANATEATSSLRVLRPYQWLLRYISEQRQEPSDEQTVVMPDRLETGLSLKGVSFTYPNAERPALDDVSIDLRPGTVTAIVGDHGSGKSTLIKVLAGLYQADEGEVLLEGRPLSAYPAADVRRRTVATFQDFARYEVTLATAVGIGDIDQLDSPGAVARAIDQGMAREVADKLPSGEQTQLGTELGGVNLSEGQWQRVALARAAMRETPVLCLLDEPTAALDAKNEDTIFSHLTRRSQALAAVSGAITVIVSHRFSTVADADQILVFSEGRVTEAGNHAELMARQGYYARTFKLQAAGYAAEELPLEMGDGA
ncbi:ATP-binding cassette domain-containing protein [Actinomyces trachealis]|uniref:ATP-binding cassette domain-containing protein n=1 Tax=Actinomyces trachealis TaxID=2763540 RepID=UPI0018C78C15|nr:ABC transporter ATP-binding protein [Actinomyces trachealis]